MHSIRTKITAVTVTSIVVAMVVATIFGVIAIRNIGMNSSNESLLLLCEVGEKNLDAYFDSVEKSVEMVSAYVETDLDGIDDEHLQAHLDRVSDIFKEITYNENGILTYYYRIDPKVSEKATGFWYVNLDGKGFVEHEPTDITQYDTDDTSKLVWFTVPKATGKPMWLPPYITDNLANRVISYNVPIYYKDSFVGVIGIEIDYSTMADQVDHISLYDNGYAFINDAEGTIIYHPHMDVTTMEEQPKVPDGLLSDDKFITYTYDGVEKQAAWLPLENGMRLNVTVPTAEVDAIWQQWALQIVGIFCIILIVAIVIIMRFTGHITKPLRRLTDAARQVDNGNYDFKVEYTGDDEVGVLSRTFGQLTSHLKEYITDLNDLAYADALTSVHNKGAFDIFAKNLQAQLDDPRTETEFAICIFDCNGLKEVNDRFGHGKGDVFLKKSCHLICKVFSHSPVFRIGGDEFVTVLSGDDYAIRDELVALFDEKCAETRETSNLRWEQLDIACGMAVYDADEDSAVDDVVRRADKLMYERKRQEKAARNDGSDGAV